MELAGPVLDYSYYASMRYRSFLNPFESRFKLKQSIQRLLTLRPIPENHTLFSLYDGTLSLSLAGMRKADPDPDTKLCVEAC